MTASLQDIFKRLHDWGRYPKYALERRLDIFLTPFLAKFVGDSLAGSSTAGRDDFVLAMPEFPIRHGKSFQTINADYLLYRPATNEWLLLELKTDLKSVSDKQLAEYRRLRTARRTMKELLDDVELVRRHSRTSYRVKYRRILRKLPELMGRDMREHILDGRVDFMYIAPPGAKLGKDEVISFDRLKDWDRCPAEHRELKDLVMTLMADLSVTDQDDLAAEAEAALHARASRKRASGPRGKQDR